ncbi:hypothetical protein AZE42_13918 [Rhizopogon vesiculosus]|uniref:Uncharacterized protein n=1 Tax=Rhizopogon vesiculosus TaxID=180088 RepID=A0A1J8QDY2_9AGAM|nr:hypothetical protein AZE42_13918 [Rhizopogon vesiculosus]
MTMDGSTPCHAPSSPLIPNPYLRTITQIALSPSSLQMDVEGDERRPSKKMSS